MVLRGKWAQGIEPRNFTWIMQGRLAVCERPGGYGQNHRKVRRQEEIIWLREQGFTLIVSVSASPHNLHNYDEMEMPWIHRPFAAGPDAEGYLAEFFPQLRSLLVNANKVVVHADELGDNLAGLMAAYVLWNKLVPAGPQAISVVEQLLHRQLGPTARGLVALVPRLPEPDATEVEPVVPMTVDELAAAGQPVDGLDEEGGEMEGGDVEDGADGRDDGGGG